MAEFTPRTGAVIDFVMRPEPLDEREQAFAEWAASRGLAVIFGRVYPGDEDDFEPFLSYELVLEEYVDGKIVAQHMTVSPTEHPPALAAAEELLRLSFEQTKERLA